MGPYSEMVCNGYIRISDSGSMPRADGFHCRAFPLSFGLGPLGIEDPQSVCKTVAFQALFVGFGTCFCTLLGSR